MTIACIVIIVCLLAFILDMKDIEKKWSLPQKPDYFIYRNDKTKKSDQSDFK